MDFTKYLERLDEAELNEEPFKMSPEHEERMKKERLY